MKAIRLRYLAAVNPPVRSWNSLPDDMDVTFLPLEAVWPESIDFSQRRTKSEVASGYTRFQEGDIVVPKITPTFQADRSTLIQGMPTTVGAGTTELHVIRPHPGVEPRYIGYLVSSRPFLKGGEAQMVGVAGQKRVPDSWIRDYGVPVTDTNTQRAIADFLDTATTRLGALIAKKRRMIELLSQRAMSIGTIAAWGTDYEERIRRAPIGPIDSLPRTWSLLRNKVFVREVNDRSSDGSEELLSVSHLTGVTPRSEKNVTMFMAESLDGYKLVQPGDLVINTMWAWMGAAGVSVQPGIVSPAYGVYRLDQSVMSPAYYDILIRTPAYITEMTRFSRGVWTSRLRLYPDEFLRLSSPVPPLEVQAEIVDRVAEANALASRAATTLEQAVDLLVERRQALITAAVTGELEVAESIAEEAS